MRLRHSGTTKPCIVTMSGYKVGEMAAVCYATTHLVFNAYIMIISWPQINISWEQINCDLAFHAHVKTILWTKNSILYRQYVSYVATNLYFVQTNSVKSILCKRPSIDTLFFSTGALNYSHFS